MLTLRVVMNVGLVAIAVNGQVILNIIKYIKEGKI